ncbi:MAG: S-methyl-5-thioribose-1-phosphate isomerase [Tindallia sp. MSAO_Bac2]|nr:MAG: S-methyl-5-thioribose-1-phosphate isomerase [Tindallia sp. MSAO_Bac2]
MLKPLNENQEAFHTIRLLEDRDALEIIDQTLLPGETRYIVLENIEDIWEAIYQLRVRGAPAIGIAAAYGVYLASRWSHASTYFQLYDVFMKNKEYLASSRPTAVNLFWALNRMEDCLKRHQETTVEKALLELKLEATKIQLEDEEVCRSIGEHALTLLKPGWGILTHCNAGALATSRFGTALSPLYLGQQQGYDFNVYADETRPLLQGARLTTWELQQAGVNVTLICDNMASIVMQEGKVQAVITGCDRVAANGDAANKIGTSGVAILAKHYNIPFYICAPLSTIDFDCPTGGDIEIEQRPSEEVVSKWYEKPMAPENIKVYNPAFDVTDQSLITAIITEKGVLKSPYSEALKEVKKQIGK